MNDERILELWELVPPAKQAAQKAAARLDEAKKKLAERRKVAMQEKTTRDGVCAPLEAPARSNKGHTAYSARAL